MALNPFGHIDLRVNDRAVARAFYGQLLPALGFPNFSAGESFDCYVAEGQPPRQAWFGYTEQRDHRPNANRIAFAVDSRAEVDRLAALARRAGAGNVSGPKAMPQYGPSYYAVFFEDPFGNPLEVVYTTD